MSLTLIRIKYLGKYIEIAFTSDAQRLCISLSLGLKEALIFLNLKTIDRWFSLKTVFSKYIKFFASIYVLITKISK